MKQSRRIAPRVPYGEAVSVFRTDGSARIYARGIDLSAVGIQLSSTESWPIGTDVRCTLLLPGGPRTVGGRIVRVTALPRGVATAIAFSFLSAGAAAAIVQLVEARQRAPQPAKLRVAGMDRPLRCQGRLDEGTVRLTAALPFLKLHGDVEVVIGDDGQAASGVISKIALDPSPTDGVPRLSLEVELATGASAASRAPTGVPMPPPKLRAPSPRPGPSVILSRTFQHEVRFPQERPPRRRRQATAEIARRPRSFDSGWPPRRAPTLPGLAAPNGTLATVGAPAPARRSWLARAFGLSSRRSP